MTAFQPATHRVIIADTRLTGAGTAIIITPAQGFTSRIAIAARTIGTTTSATIGRIESTLVALTRAAPHPRAHMICGRTGVISAMERTPVARTQAIPRLHAHMSVTPVAATRAGASTAALIAETAIPA